jgi:hypothetical protein
MCISGRREALLQVTRHITERRPKPIKAVVPSINGLIDIKRERLEEA